MSKPISFKKDTHAFSSKAKKQDYPFSTGQKIMYEGEEAEIISVKPLLVIKSRNRVVCGDLYKHLSI